MAKNLLKIHSKTYTLVLDTTKSLWMQKTRLLSRLYKTEYEMEFTKKFTYTSYLEGHNCFQILEHEDRKNTLRSHQ